ncbi:hypothetical protein CDL12_13615 [Handroanthus impetiginosus]|uniref:Uncharacterized protein n=1 Tax=Handroanthus impetiginosus TaxID=429701 RepID=A0A2G9H8A7_9LAMI|nr:hypothetical protein CDL12_13615 [Handroanthus impetiginosus]
MHTARCHAHLVKESLTTGILNVHYDSMQMTVFYEDQSIGGMPLMCPFYQEPKNTMVIARILGGASLSPMKQQWEQFMAARGLGEVVFRIEVTSIIWFKILPSYRDKRCQIYFS